MIPLAMALLLTHCALQRNPAYTPEQQFFADSYELLADAAKIHETSMVTIGILHRDGVIDDETLFKARTIGKALESSLRAYRATAQAALDAGTSDRRSLMMAISETSRLIADLLAIIEEHKLHKTGDTL